MKIKSVPFLLQFISLQVALVHFNRKTKTAFWVQKIPMMDMVDVNKTKPPAWD